MSKRKGSVAERDLIRLFWGAGWAAIRSAGSGSMHFPSPDILAGNKIRRLSIEVKTINDNKKYFPHDEIKQLYNFASYFGSEAWVAIKFPQREWVFVNPEDLTDTGNSFVFSVKDIESKGLSFEEITSY